MRYAVPLAAASILLLVGACSSKTTYQTASATQTPIPAAAGQAGAPGAPDSAGARPDVPGQSSRVSGNVLSVTAGQVALSDGTTFSLAPNVRVVRQQNVGAGDLQKGELVAITAKRQPDNTLLASIVSIFPPSRSSLSTGQSPLPEGNLMTNATIDTLSGKSFTVSFTGGGAQITLAPNAEIIKQSDATAADLLPGSKVSAGVNNGIAQSVTIQ